MKSSQKIVRKKNLCNFNKHSGNEGNQTVSHEANLCEIATTSYNSKNSVLIYKELCNFLNSGIKENSLK